MLSAYPACFFKEESGYSVIFPDLNYLATCGDDLNDAIAMSVDCLAGYLYDLQQEGEAAPAPSSVDVVSPEAVAKELELAPDYEFFTTLITVDVSEYAKTHFEKSVKKTLTIPAWLNKAALEQNINFSQVLQEALKSKLHIN